MFEALQDYSQGSCMSVEPSGVFVNTVDNDNVSIFRLKWYKEAFLDFQCRKSFKFNVTPANVVKVLKLLDSKDNVTMGVKSSEDLSLEFKTVSQNKNKNELGSKQASFSIPINESHKDECEEMQFPVYGDDRAEAIIPCSLWEEQLSEVSSFTPIVKLCCGQGAIHIESDNENVVHRILYVSSQMMNNAQKEAVAKRGLRVQEAITEEHRIQDELYK